MRGYTRLPHLERASAALGKCSGQHAIRTISLTGWFFNKYAYKTIHNGTAVGLAAKRLWMVAWDT